MAGEKDGEHPLRNDEEMSTDNEDETMLWNSETMLSDSASDTHDGEFDDELMTGPGDDDDRVPMAHHKL